MSKRRGSHEGSIHKRRDGRWVAIATLGYESGRRKLLAIQSVRPRVAMEMFGHSDISLTMNVYSHVTQDLQRATAAKVDAFLIGGA